MTEIKPAAPKQSGLSKIRNHHYFLPILAAVVIIAVLGGLMYWNVSNSRVYVDKSSIFAASVDLAPQNPGLLEEVMVNEGDMVQANTVVARVCGELVKTKVAGIIVSVKKNIGKLFNRGEAVASMIIPQDLRVEGMVDETKGLNDIKVGQPAIFTVDAFGSKEFQGVVDEVSPASKESGVVFSISDKRETKQFIVKVRFNVDLYPELKKGMSAKMWVYLN